MDVLILFSSGVPAHARLAERLEHALSAGPYRVHRMAVDAVRARGVQKPPPHQTYHYAVAVGLEAARVATEELRLATVFCQIFNYQPLLAGGAPPVWGVSALPPLELQLRAWKELDPSLARVGMIVAPDHDELLREALAAGRTAGVAIRYERSSSDRQTLYHFRRLAREVDGLWLFPDNRILSPAVIAEMLEQGAANGTQITAFNASSPPPGVLMTAGASPADVADTVALVMARLVAGEIDELAAITPLSRVEIDIDRDVAARLGLTVPALSRATP